MSSGTYKDKSKPTQVRLSNIAAGRAIADAVRTSLGPKGMDKMIESSKGEITISNDGATIMSLMTVLHPAAKMLVQLSKAQDVEAGDGTTSVVVLAGSLLGACEALLAKGIHPTIISEGFGAAALKTVEILEHMSLPVRLDDREQLLKTAATSLNSKVVGQYSDLLAPMVVDAILRVADADNVDLRSIKLVKKLGGTIEDTELVDGVVLDRRFAHAAGGAERVEKAKIALCQFCLSPPKTDLDNQVIVSDYAQMDRVLREERQYLLNLCKKIKKTGCNVILLQKSILRDAVSDLALHFLAKMNISVVKDIERDEVDFICKSLGCKPIASMDHFLPEFFASADLVEEVATGSSKCIKISGVTGHVSKTVSVLVRGSNKLMLEETDRSLHDALCVIRCLVKRRAVICGGGAPEIEVALRLSEYAATVPGVQSYVLKAFAEALEVIPFTLAENAGLNPIATVTELRAAHKAGELAAGINVRKGCITNINEENVLQPLLVNVSAITLATETVRSILKIDDIINTR